MTEVDVQEIVRKAVAALEIRVRQRTELEGGKSIVVSLWNGDTKLSEDYMYLPDLLGIQS